MEDYSITWKYLVDEMERKHGISPSSEKPRSLGDIFALLYEIWDVFVDAKRAEYSHNREANSMDYKTEYHEGYYAAGNGIPYDEAWSDARKEGYRDGIASLYGDDE